MNTKLLSDLFVLSKDLKVSAGPEKYLSAVSLQKLFVNTIISWPHLTGNPTPFFPGAEIYFKTITRDIYMISSVKQKDESFKFFISSTKPYFMGIELEKSFIRYAVLKVDDEFYFSSLYSEPVTDIVLVTQTILDNRYAEALHESEIVKEFKNLTSRLY